MEYFSCDITLHCDSYPMFVTMSFHVVHSGSCADSSALVASTLYTCGLDRPADGAKKNSLGLHLNTPRQSNFIGSCFWNRQAFICYILLKIPNFSLVG